MESQKNMNRASSFVLQKGPPRRMTPSIYEEEILQTTEERMENIMKDVYPPQILEHLDIDTSPHRVYNVPVDRALFQPTPNELIFQNFSPGQTYQLPLQLCNIDVTPRTVKVEMSQSDYFRVDGPQNMCVKVVPGLHAKFTIFFRPTEFKDYNQSLVCVTEREKFVVTVRAIGPRAILTFRDEVKLPDCLVKATKETFMWVRNTGKAPATFQLHTESPFSVTPLSAFLGVGDSMSVIVKFSPKTTGNYSQDLRLHYHTGEDVYMNVHGVCKDIDIGWRYRCVTMKDTFVSKCSTSLVGLFTKSPPETLSFRWTHWASEQEETASRESGRYDMERTTSCFSIEPEEYSIGRPMEFFIFFKPKEAKLYDHTMYLDITGCAARLPLKLMGQGLGPLLELQYTDYEMGDVTYKITYLLMVKLSNIGQLDAHFAWSVPDTTNERCWSVDPDHGDIAIGETQDIEISFKSYTVGNISEELLVTVRGQPHPLVFPVRGRVIGPTCHFSVSQLNFGDVAFGFPHTVTCELENTSIIEMTYTLRVLGDGQGPASVACDRQLPELPLMHPDQWQGSGDPALRPVEFTVSPASGELDRKSSVLVKVTLCSNTVKNYSIVLVIDLEDVGKEVITLPINARCVVPELIVENPLLDYRRCFLNHQYTQSAWITNNHCLPACYGVLDQSEDSETSSMLLFGSTQACGVVPANSTVDVPIHVQIQAVGRQQCTAYITVFGRTQAPLEVALTGIGQGAVVYIRDREVDFGDVPVCKDISRTLRLSNQSPIPAQFTACVAEHQSIWRVEPTQGEVPPEGQREVQITANLRNAGLYKGRLDVAVHNNNIQAIPLLAKGIGTTIFSDPPIPASLDLGVHIRQCVFRFTLTNHGTRPQNVKWVTEDQQLFSYLNTKSQSKMGSTLPPIAPPKNRSQADKRGCTFPPIAPPKHRGQAGKRSSTFLPITPPKNRGQDDKRGPPKKILFSVTPMFYRLPPGASCNMVLTAQCETPEIVHEHLECYSMIQSKSYERIMAVDVTCQFINHVVTMAPEQLTFCATKVPGEGLVAQYQKLVLKNASSITLYMDVSLPEPFALCDAAGSCSACTTKAVVLGGDRDTTLWVCFNPGYYNDQMSHKVHEMLQVCSRHHPLEQSVPLHAQIHYPNLKLSANRLDFGCVLNSTQTRKSLTITNCSVLPVEYSWSFLMDHNQYVIRYAEELEYDPEIEPLAMENVFDINPIFGAVQPAKSQTVTFTFFGQANICACVLAQCHVKDGPIYEVLLRGEASHIVYQVEPTHIDLGLQLFDSVAQAQLTLSNPGKVNFTFNVSLLRTDEEDSVNDRMENVKPGRPVVIPATGYMEAGQTCVLQVCYLPGVPDAFNSSFLLHVAHLPAHTITLTGKGIFPRILLELPLELLQEGYPDLIAEAKAVIEESQGRETSQDGDRARSPYTPGCDELLHMEMERKLVSQNALDVMGTLKETAQSSNMFRKRLSRFEILEYVLDFGDVISNGVYSHTVKITNPGPMAVSLTPKKTALAGTAFATEFYNVRNLPCGETHTFTVTFDHQKSVPEHERNISAILPIQVLGGPTVLVKLCALLIFPALKVSKNKLNFGRVQCGMCQVITIQLWNYESVFCEWKMDEQRKRGQKNVFRVEPSSGCVHPGERVSVQVMFLPAEKRNYSRQLLVRVSKGRQSLMLDVQGQGEEPQLMFTNLSLGPCLSLVAEGEIIVRNPCPYPIEFYSLEYDNQYLEEEKILRLITCGDEQDMLLLPPRDTGEGLPAELLHYVSERQQGNQDLMDPVSSALARYRSSQMPAAARSSQAQPAPQHGHP